MTIKKYNLFFFMFVFVLVCAAVLFIIRPFITAIITAAIISVTFQRPYNFLVKITRGQKRISSILTCILIIVVLIVPASLTARLIVGELHAFYTNLPNYENTVEILLSKGDDILNKYDIKKVNLKEIIKQKDLTEFLKSAGEGAVFIIQRTYKGITGFILWFFSMMFTVYFFLIDGDKLIEKIKNLSPLPSNLDSVLMEKFTSISRAIFKGTFVVAVIQGIIGGTMFALLGVQSPVIWGVIIVVLAVIPIIGASLVWGPFGIIMLIQGNIAQGIIILAVGAGVISAIDNLLRPKLVGDDTRLHPLLVFFSSLGGIYFFGIIGLIIGPVIMGFFLALIETYEHEIKDYLNLKFK